MADLVDGYNYMFSVRALNSIGYSAYSEPATFLAASVPSKPSAPVIVQATSSSISITWTQPYNGGSPITNYYVYVAQGPTVTNSQFTMIADTAETMLYTMTSLIPAQTYWFKIAAKNLVGTGQKSDSVNRIAATIPAPPINLAMVEQGTAKVSFTWDANDDNGGSDVTDYAIYWNQGSGTIQYEVITSNGLTPTLATISSPILLADKEYMFWVKARNAVGYSAFSNPLTIHSATNPGAPGSPFRMSTTSKTQVVVGWTANSANNFGGSTLLSYQVWWDQGDSVNNFVLYNTVPSSVYSQIVSPVTTSAYYQFYIVAQNVIGNSIYSEIVTI